ncbi:hypothetical protein GYMLUDRAFT_168213, partial [Collybiopsis luxurians FD-317 M1]
DALKVLSNNRHIFRRDIEGYRVVSVYGPNMVACEGVEWKRHRAVAKPAFNEKNNMLVWLHASRICNEWFDYIDRHLTGTDQIEIDLLKDCTEIALLIFSSAAFGHHSSWLKHSTDSMESLHEVPFRQAVTSAVNNLVTKILTPPWMLVVTKYIPVPYVSKLFKETQGSFEALRLHMLNIISSSRAWVSGGNTLSMDATLLTNLVHANMAQEIDPLQKKCLTNEELLSNTFMFLLAGHETSAHSLCFAFCLMALWPEVQEKVYKETAELWPNVPTMETVNASYTTAVFRETLRLFPPVPRIASPVSSNTVLTGRRFTQNSREELTGITKFTTTIPEESLVVIDIIALHMNPIHWGKDARDFRPERFIDTDTYHWPRDAFLAFSAGPRSCLGEQFALIESICVLANVIRKYEVSVPNNLLRKSRSDQLDHLLHWIPRMTLIPSNSLVNFRHRQ